MTEWGSWIKNDRNGCPVPLGTVIEIVGVRTDYQPYSLILVVDDAAYSSPCWGAKYPGQMSPCGIYDMSTVDKYRIRQFSAMSDLKRIAENPQPVEEVS